MRVINRLYVTIAAMVLVSAGGVSVASASTSPNPPKPQSYCLIISPMSRMGFAHSCGYTRSECNRYKSQELAKFIKKNPKYKKTARAGCSVE